MTDWYLRKTWTLEDQEEFFKRLSRARKDGRAQYLRIQAYQLIETRKEELLSVAETLLNKILTDYPENRIEKSGTLCLLGEIYKIRKEYEIALEYFGKSLTFEKEFPNVITTAYLEFAQTVILTKKTEFYDQVESLLVEKINDGYTLGFPYQDYIIFSILAIISKHKGNSKQARIYEDLAEKNASAKTNSLWKPQKKKWGIVKKRIDWLDELVKNTKKPT